MSRADNLKTISDERALRIKTITQKYLGLTKINYVEPKAQIFETFETCLAALTLGQILLLDRAADELNQLAERPTLEEQQQELNDHMEGDWKTH
jgi:hypothetical protein